MQMRLVAVSLMAIMITAAPVLAADHITAAPVPAANMPGMKGKMAPSPVATPAPSAGDQKLVESALEAAPAKVAAGATVVAMDKDGQMRTLRQGTNGFTCMPDDPQTPGPDPMCMDKNAMEWVSAMMAHKTPAEGKSGLMYMLAGGTDASNTDPYAKQPTADNHWIKTGPHIMMVGSGAAFYDQYPKKADPDTSAPYVMWAGTPYQHLMIPVR